MSKSKDTLAINLFQYDVQWLKPKDNIRQIKNHLESLSYRPDLVVLPEMFLTGFCMNAKKSGLKESSTSVKEVIKLCKKYKTHFLGSLAIKEKGKFYNRMLLIGRDGILDRYDKLHLFTPSGEGESFSAKYPPTLFELNGWKILPQVCYDLRFPETIRSLDAPDLLVYSANWPKPRIQHWDALLKARSIENQCFTIGLNRTGKDNNNWEYPGHSKLLSFDGSTINDVDKERNSVIIIEKKMMEDYRSKYPFLLDKTP